MWGGYGGWDNAGEIHSIEKSTACQLKYFVQDGYMDVSIWIMFIGPPSPWSSGHNHATEPGLDHSELKASTSPSSSFYDQRELRAMAVEKIVHALTLHELQHKISKLGTGNVVLAVLLTGALAIIADYAWMLYLRSKMVK
jgi:hypothetical protein